MLPIFSIPEVFVIFAAIAFFVWLLFHEIIYRSSLTVKSAYVRNRPIIRTLKYGTVMVVEGKRLADDKFLLTMLDKSGRKVTDIFYEHQIVSGSNFFNLCGAGSPEYIEVKAKAKSGGLDEKDLRSISEEHKQVVKERDFYKNRDILTRSNYNEQLDRLCSYLEKLEAARGKHLRGDKFGGGI